MVMNIRDYGAVGDGITDDRQAIQTAILAAGACNVLVIPAGQYLVGKGAGFWGLVVPAACTGLLIRGEPGAVLLQAGGMPANVRLLQIEAGGVTIEDLTLDGNKAAQAPDEHRAGIFATNAPGLTLRRVTSIDSTGDGFYIHIGSHNAWLEDCSAHGNSRNGLTFGGGTVGGMARRCVFTGNAAQQIDSEPGPGFTADDVTITGCTLEGSGDFVLTVSGSGTGWRSRGWRIHDNILNGPTNIVWATDVVMRDNRGGRNATTKPCVQVYRNTDQVLLERNDFISSAAPSALNVFGTGIGQSPSRITIRDNNIRAVNSAHGVHIVAARSVTVIDNEIRGAGVAAPFLAGVYARSTVVGLDIESLVVRRNRISDFGSRGVVATAAPGAIRFVDVSDNHFDDTGGSMLSAMSFDVAADARQSGNLLYGGCTTMVASPASGVWKPWGNGDRWVMP